MHESSTISTVRRVGVRLRLLRPIIAGILVVGVLGGSTVASAANKPGGRCSKVGSVVFDSFNKKYLTCMRGKGKTTVWMAPLGRSDTDRPGSNTADVKFVYLTFKNGPDAKRDSSGDIAVMADQVASYFRSQNPGKQLRFDLYNGQLDVQHIAAPITNAEFRALWPPPNMTSEGCPDPNEVCRSASKYPDFMEQLLNSNGLKWSHNHGVMRAYGQNNRLYDVVFEGYRGQKCENGLDSQCHEYECGPVGIEWDGLVGKFMRKNDLNQCEQTQALWGQKTGEPVNFMWWGIEIVRRIVKAMTSLPGCGKEVQEYIDMPYQLRPYVMGSDYDIWGQDGNWWKLFKWPNLPGLDVDHKYYFKIDNGPRVGNKCWDIQYSPYWMPA